MKRKHGFLGLIIILVVAIGIYLVTSYNGFVRKDADVSNAWSQVETNYQRRADLIPNLVQTIKGYAQHEQTTFTQIAALRSGYQAAKTPAEFEGLDQKLRASINVVFERYPELKANENFLSLQDELTGTENRIAIARRDYNTVATAFNKKVKVFPGNLIAKLFGFTSRELFTATKGAEQAPVVDFGTANSTPTPAPTVN